MAQIALVEDEIQAGAELVEKLDTSLSVKAAFWLKSDEEKPWNLYVATDLVNGGHLREGYEKVLPLVREMQNPNLPLYRVKLIGTDDPLARATLDYYQLYPGRIPIRLHSTMFGGMWAEEVYIYPLPITVPG